MAMIPRTQQILSVTGQTGALAATNWYDMPDSGSGKHDVAISLTAGTATWVLQGRNSPLDAAQQLDTGSASKMSEVPRFRQIRVTLTAAAAATLVATADTAGKQV